MNYHTDAGVEYSDGIDLTTLDQDHRLRHLEALGWHCSPDQLRHRALSGTRAPRTPAEEYENPGTVVHFVDRYEKPGEVVHLGS